MASNRVESLAPGNHAGSLWNYHTGDVVNRSIAPAAVVPALRRGVRGILSRAG